MVLGCETKKNRTLDSVNLLNYGYNAFKEVELKSYIRESICISVEKSKGGLYRVSKDINLKYPLKDDEISNIQVKYNIMPNLVAPLKMGTKVADIEIFLEGTKICEINYELPTNIEKKDWKDYFKEILNEKLTNVTELVMY